MDNYPDVWLCISDKTPIDWKIWYDMFTECYDGSLKNTSGMSIKRKNELIGVAYVANAYINFILKWDLPDDKDMLLYSFLVDKMIPFQELELGIIKLWSYDEIPILFQVREKAAQDRLYTLPQEM